MCLRKTAVAVKWDSKKKAYIGIGYKKMSLIGSGWRIGRWREATGDYFYKKELKDKLILDDNYSSCDNREYHPGFHIFTKLDDAKVYSNGGGGDKVYEVEYKEILAFGTNHTYNDKGYGPCVIARFMKIVKEIA